MIEKKSRKLLRLSLRTLGIGLIVFSSFSAKNKSNSRWSIASEDSCLSIASKGSFLSIGSVGSAFSVLSLGSFASVGSVLSFASLFGLLQSKKKTIMEKSNQVEIKE